MKKPILFWVTPSQLASDMAPCYHRGDCGAWRETMIAVSRRNVPKSWRRCARCKP